MRVPWVLVSSAVIDRWSDDRVLALALLLALISMMLWGVAAARW